VATPEYLKLKPVDAIAALRDRLALPLSDYKGLDARIHDHAFMVSGLMRADLLEATKWLIGKALEDGTSFEQFTRSFNRRIGRAGYQPSGQRIKLVFDTNINKSYWQGREKVMRSPEMMAKRPLWLFRHRDSVTPRPSHAALHNKAIPADHDFWKKISFPISFNCKCSAYPVTEDYCKRNGIEILYNPPDPDTLIDNPSFKRGTDNKTRQQILEQGLKRLSPDLRTQVKKQIKANA
jgi:hypothetical protein